MMRVNRYLAGLLGMAMVCGISGCAVWPQRYLLTAQPLIEAPGAPLEPGETNPWAGVSDTFTPLDQVHYMVQDSLKKCEIFIDSMFAQNAGTGLTLDVLNTTTSALATVFTPLAATHALSAASTIFGGARTSITAEYLNSLTTSHITQAIQSTYYADMQKYITWLDTQPSTLDPVKERSKILSYHNECSLASAEGSISSTLQSAASTPTTQPTVSYKVLAGDAPPDIAKQLAMLVSASAAFKNAGVTATANGQDPIVQFTNSGTSTITATISSPVSAAAPTATAHFSGSPPNTLTIGGTATANDLITITLVAAPAASPPAAQVGKAITR